MLLVFVVVGLASHDFTSFSAALLIVNDQRTPRAYGVSGLPLLGRPLWCGVLPGCFPRHAGFPCIHADWPIISGHVGGVHSCSVLATDLASIRLNVTVAYQQLSNIKLTLGNFRHTCGGGVVNLYAFIVFDSRRYPDKSNSCANHLFT
jgi:hypothetical protein